MMLTSSSTVRIAVLMMKLKTMTLTIISRRRVSSINSSCMRITMFEKQQKKSSNFNINRSNNNSKNNKYCSNINCGFKKRNNRIRIGCQTDWIIILVFVIAVFLAVISTSTVGATGSYGLAVPLQGLSLAIAILQQQSTLAMADYSTITTKNNKNDNHRQSVHNDDYNFYNFYGDDYSDSDNSSNNYKNSKNNNDREHQEEHRRHQESEDDATIVLVVSKFRLRVTVRRLHHPPSLASSRSFFSQLSPSCQRIVTHHVEVVNLDTREHVIIHSIETSSREETTRLIMIDDQEHKADDDHFNNDTNINNDDKYEQIRQRRFQQRRRQQWRVLQKDHLPYRQIFPTVNLWLKEAPSPPEKSYRNNKKGNKIKSESEAKTAIDLKPLESTVIPISFLPRFPPPLLQSSSSSTLTESELLIVNGLDNSDENNKSKSSLVDGDNNGSSSDCRRVGGNAYVFDVDDIDDEFDFMNDDQAGDDNDIDGDLQHDRLIYGSEYNYDTSHTFLDSAEYLISSSLSSPIENRPPEFRRLQTHHQQEPRQEQQPKELRVPAYDNFDPTSIRLSSSTRKATLFLEADWEDWQRRQTHHQKHRFDSFQESKKRRRREKCSNDNMDNYSVSSPECQENHSIDQTKYNQHNEQRRKKKRSNFIPLQDVTTMTHDRTTWTYANSKSDKDRCTSSSSDFSSPFSPSSCYYYFRVRTELSIGTNRGVVTLPLDLYSKRTNEYTLPDVIYFDLNPTRVNATASVTMRSSDTSSFPHVVGIKANRKQEQQSQLVGNSFLSKAKVTNRQQQQRNQPSPSPPMTVVGGNSAHLSSPSIVRWSSVVTTDEERERVIADTLELFRTTSSTTSTSTKTIHHGGAGIKVKSGEQQYKQDPINPTIGTTSNTNFTRIWIIDRKSSNGHPFQKKATKQTSSRQTSGCEGDAECSDNDDNTSFTSSPQTHFHDYPKDGVCDSCCYDLYMRNPFLSTSYGTNNKNKHEDKNINLTVVEAMVTIPKYAYLQLSSSLLSSMIMSPPVEKFTASTAHVRYPPRLTVVRDWSTPHQQQNKNNQNNNTRNATNDYPLWIPSDGRQHYVITVCVHTAAAAMRDYIESIDSTVDQNTTKNNIAEDESILQMLLQQQQPMDHINNYNNYRNDNDPNYTKADHKHNSNHMGYVVLRTNQGQSLYVALERRTIQKRIQRRLRNRKTHNRSQQLRLHLCRCNQDHVDSYSYKIHNSSMMGRSCINNHNKKKNTSRHDNFDDQYNEDNNRKRKKLKGKRIEPFIPQLRVTNWTLSSKPAKTIKFRFMQTGKTTQTYTIGLEWWWFDNYDNHDDTTSGSVHSRNDNSSTTYGNSKHDHDNKFVRQMFLEHATLAIQPPPDLTMVVTDANSNSRKDFGHDRRRHYSSRKSSMTTTPQGKFLERLGLTLRIDEFHNNRKSNHSSFHSYDVLVKKNKMNKQSNGGTATIRTVSAGFVKLTCTIDWDILMRPTNQLLTSMLLLSLQSRQQQTSSKTEATPASAEEILEAASAWIELHGALVARGTITNQRHRSQQHYHHDDDNNDSHNRKTENSNSNGEYDGGYFNHQEHEGDENELVVLEIPLSVTLCKGSISYNVDLSSHPPWLFFPSPPPPLTTSTGSVTGISTTKSKLGVERTIGSGISGESFEWGMGGYFPISMSSYWSSITSKDLDDLLIRYRTIDRAYLVESFRFHIRLVGHDIDHIVNRNISTINDNDGCDDDNHDADDDVDKNNPKRRVGLFNASIVPSSTSFVLGSSSSLTSRDQEFLCTRFTAKILDPEREGEYHRRATSPSSLLTYELGTIVLDYSIPGSLDMSVSASSRNNKRKNTTIKKMIDEEQKYYPVAFCSLQVTTFPDFGIHEMPLVLYSGHVSIIQSSSLSTIAKDHHRVRMRTKHAYKSINKLYKNNDGFNDSNSLHLEQQHIIGFSEVLHWFRSTRSGSTLRRLLLHSSTHFTDTGRKIDNYNKHSNKTTATLLRNYLQSLVTTSMDPSNISITRYNNHLLHPSKHQEQLLLRPIVVQAGSILTPSDEDKSGSDDDMIVVPLLISNHHPIPVTMQIDVGEVEGLAIAIGRDRVTSVEEKNRAATRTSFTERERIKKTDGMNGIFGHGDADADETSEIPRSILQKRSIMDYIMAHTSTSGVKSSEFSSNTMVDNANAAINAHRQRKGWSHGRFAGHPVGALRDLLLNEIRPTSHRTTTKNVLGNFLSRFQYQDAVTPIVSNDDDDHENDRGRNIMFDNLYFHYHQNTKVRFHKTSKPSRLVTTSSRKQLLSKKTSSTCCCNDTCNQRSRSKHHCNHYHPPEYGSFDDVTTSLRTNSNNESQALFVSGPLIFAVTNNGDIDNENVMFRNLPIYWSHHYGSCMKNGVYYKSNNNSIPNSSLYGSDIDERKNDCYVCNCCYPCCDRSAKVKAKVGETTVTSTGDQVVIPPGGMVRMDIYVRCPPVPSPLQESEMLNQSKIIDNDIRQFVASGLVLSTRHGEILPILVSFEGIHGKLDISTTETTSSYNTINPKNKPTSNEIFKGVKNPNVKNQSNPNKEKRRATLKKDEWGTTVVQVPTSPFHYDDGRWNPSSSLPGGSLEHEELASILIPPSFFTQTITKSEDNSINMLSTKKEDKEGNASTQTNVSSKTGKNRDNVVHNGGGVSLYVKSSFRRHIKLRRVHSVNPWFYVQLMRDEDNSYDDDQHATADYIDDRHKQNAVAASNIKGKFIGTIHTRIPCFPTSATTETLDGVNIGLYPATDFPSYYRCFVQWLAEKSSLQPHCRSCYNSTHGRQQQFTSSSKSVHTESEGVEDNVHFAGSKDDNDSTNDANGKKDDRLVRIQQVLRRTLSVIEWNDDFFDTSASSSLSSKIVAIIQNRRKRNTSTMKDESNNTNNIHHYKYANFNNRHHLAKEDKVRQRPKIDNSAVKSGRRGDGTTSLLLIDSVAKARQALHVANNYGWLTLQTYLDFLVEYSSTCGNTLRCTFGNETQQQGGGRLHRSNHRRLLSSSIHDVTFEAELELPELLDKQTLANNNKYHFAGASGSVSRKVNYSSTIPQSFIADRNDVAYFQPTLVGSVSSLRIPLYNPSPVYVRVRITVAPMSMVDKDEDDVDIEYWKQDLVGTYQPPYVQQTNKQYTTTFMGYDARSTQKSSDSSSWWDWHGRGKRGAFYQKDFHGNILRSDYNTTFFSGSTMSGINGDRNGGGGAYISFINPSYYACSTFLVGGCGSRCGIRNNKDTMSHLAPTSPIGASAVGGTVLVSHQRTAIGIPERILLSSSSSYNKKHKLESDGSGHVFSLEAGGSIFHNNGIGPAPFAIPFSALDEVIIPPFGHVELGPILFRPPGRTPTMQYDSDYDPSINFDMSHEWFEANVLLENSLTGLEKVTLRGKSLWEKIIFLEDVSSYTGYKDLYYEFGDVEVRYGYPTLVFTGTANKQWVTSSASFSITPVIKHVLVHNDGNTIVTIDRAYFTVPGNGKRNNYLLHADRQRRNCNSSYTLHGFSLLHHGCSCSYNRDKCSQHHEGDDSQLSLFPFTLQPGQNRSLAIEHRPKCTKKKDYVILVLVMDHSNGNIHENEADLNSSLFDGAYLKTNSSSSQNSSSKSKSGATIDKKSRSHNPHKSVKGRMNTRLNLFLNPTVELLIGFEMTDNAHLNCVPYENKFYDSLNAGSLRKTETSDHDGRNKRRLFQISLLPFVVFSITCSMESIQIYFVVMLLLCWFFLCGKLLTQNFSNISKNNQRSHLSPSIRSFTTGKDNTIPLWRYLSRTQVFSTDVRTVSVSNTLRNFCQERNRRFFLLRFKGEGMLLPQFLDDCGLPRRDRRGSIIINNHSLHQEKSIGIIHTPTPMPSSMSAEKLQNGGQNNERIRSLSDAIFGSISYTANSSSYNKSGIVTDDEQGRRSGIVPLNLGWRVAVLAGAINPMSLKEFRFQSRSKALLEERRNNELLSVECDHSIDVSEVDDDDERSKLLFHDSGLDSSCYENNSLEDNETSTKPCLDFVHVGTSGTRAIARVESNDLSSLLEFVGPTETGTIVKSTEANDYRKTASMSFYEATDVQHYRNPSTLADNGKKVVTAYGKKDYNVTTNNDTTTEKSPRPTFVVISKPMVRSTTEATMQSTITKTENELNTNKSSSTSKAKTCLGPIEGRKRGKFIPQSNIASKQSITSKPLTTRDKTPPGTRKNEMSSDVKTICPETNSSTLPELEHKTKQLVDEKILSSTKKFNRYTTTETSLPSKQNSDVSSLRTSEKQMKNLKRNVKIKSSEQHESSDNTRISNCSFNDINEPAWNLKELTTSTVAATEASTETSNDYDSLKPNISQESTIRPPPGLAPPPGFGDISTAVTSTPNTPLLNQPITDPLSPSPFSLLLPVKNSYVVSDGTLLHPLQLDSYDHHNETTHNDDICNFRELRPNMSNTNDDIEVVRGVESVNIATSSQEQPTISDFNLIAPTLHTTTSSGLTSMIADEYNIIPNNHHQNNHSIDGPNIESSVVPSSSFDFLYQWGGTVSAHETQSGGIDHSQSSSMAGFNVMDFLDDILNDANSLAEEEMMMEQAIPQGTFTFGIESDTISLPPVPQQDLRPPLQPQISGGVAAIIGVPIVSSNPWASDQGLGHRTNSISTNVNNNTSTRSSRAAAYGIAFEETIDRIPYDNSSTTTTEEPLNLRLLPQAPSFFPILSEDEDRDKYSPTYPQP